MKSNVLTLAMVFICTCAYVQTGWATAENGEGDFYWSGAVDTDFENAGNWCYGSPTGAPPEVPPKNYDNIVHVYFVDGLTDNKVVNLTRSRSIQRALFVNSADWVLVGAFTLTLKQIIVSGAVTNTMSCSVKTGNATTWSVEKGGQIVFTAGTYHDNNITFGGGGEYVWEKGMDGYSGNRYVMVTGDSLLRSETSSFFRGNNPAAYITLNSRGARLQYKTTVAAAKAKFGLTANGAAGIVNGYNTRSYALQAVDIGDGFVEVSLLSIATSMMVQ